MASPWNTLLENLENWKKEDKNYQLGTENETPTEIMTNIKNTLVDARETKQDNPQLPQICQDIREHIWDKELTEGILEQYSDQEIENEWLDQLLVFTERKGDYSSPDDQFVHLYSQKGNWRQYRGTNANMPQGWKIHVSAEPETGREVLETVQPYLWENNIDHKVRDSMKSVQRKLEDNQPDRAHKFFTIYPEANSDMLTNGEHTFEPDSTELNRQSLRANQENTEEVIEELYQALNNEDLLQGPTIDGRNGSEVQVGDTRIHFRYGKITSGLEPKVIGGREQVIDTNRIFNPSIIALDENCEKISGYTPPNKIPGLDYIETPEGRINFN